MLLDDTDKLVCIVPRLVGLSKVWEYGLKEISKTDIPAAAFKYNQPIDDTAAKGKTVGVEEKQKVLIRRHNGEVA